MIFGMVIPNRAYFYKKGYYMKRVKECDLCRHASITDHTGLSVCKFLSGQDKLPELVYVRTFDVCGHFEKEEMNETSIN